MTPIVETLLSSNLRAALLIALVYGVLRLLRTGAGESRHAVWLTAVAACLVLPLGSAVLPSLSVPLLPPETTRPVAEVPAGVTAELTGGAAVAPAPAPLGRALIWIYALGVACVLGHFAVAVRRLAMLERTMTRVADPYVIALKNALCAELRIRRRVDLLQCDRVGSPFTWGVFRPRVVLPAAAREWSGEQSRNVLLHELCHVRRFDWVRLCVQRAAVAVYWFNPCVWLAARECAYEAERACDDFVLHSGGRSSDYAEQLVEIMASSRAARVAGIGIADGGFAKRVRAILSSSKEARIMSKLNTRIVTTGVALAAVVLATCQVTSAQPADDETARLVEQQRQEEQRRVEEIARQEALRAVEERLAEQRLRERQRLDEIAREEERGALEVERQQLQQRQLERQPPRQVEQQSPARRVEAAEDRGLEQRARIAELRQALNRREVELRETQTQIQAQHRAIEELTATLERQRRALVEREHAVVELRTQLEALDRP